MLWGRLQVIFFSLSTRIPIAFSFTLGSTFTQPFLFTNQSKKKIDTEIACYAVELWPYGLGSPICLQKLHERHVDKY